MRKSNASLHLEMNVPLMDHQRHWSQLKAGDASSSNEIYETSVSCVFATSLCQTDVWKQSLFRSDWHPLLMFLCRISLFPVVVWELSLTSSRLAAEAYNTGKKSAAFLGHTTRCGFCCLDRGLMLAAGLGNEFYNVSVLCGTHILCTS